MGLKWLVFLIGFLCLIGMWFVRSKSKHHKDACCKRLDYGFQIIFIIALYFIVTRIERTWDVLSEVVNTHVLSEIITKSREVHVSICFLWMFHRRVVNGTWVALFNSNQYKLENMKTISRNNTPHAQLSVGHNNFQEHKLKFFMIRINVGYVNFQHMSKF